MVQPLITENRDKIIELCRKHHVRQLSVFGSAVRDDFDPAQSDVDLLVDFAPEPEFRYAPNFFALKHSLTQLLSREVDLVIAGSVKNPYLLRNIEGEAQVLYAA
jgi:predicted nucleotidyltransferase